MSEISEIRLVDNAVKGDLESFGVLCEKYYGAMVAIANSIVGDKHLAEDAVQSAYGKALLGIGGLKDMSRFGAWLGRICRNAAKDVLRKKGNEISTEDLRQVEARTSESEDSIAVRKAIGGLEEVERELVYMRYYNNQSYEQMSEVVGLSKAAINGRLKRIKRKLANQLKGIAEK